MYIHHNNTDRRMLINDKIELLYDFTILQDEYVKQEVKTYLLLGTCQSEIQMEQKLYNVLHGSETLAALLEREKSKIAHEGIDILSQNIADFIYEFDTCGYNNPEELVKEIIKQFKDFSTLRRAIIAFYNLELTQKKRLKALKSILIKGRN